MKMDKETLFVSFSGGRTSAYMCWWLINNVSNQYNLIFVFANTGQEHENTLEFVDRRDREFKLNLIWVEAVVHHDERKGSTHRVVSYETASRSGEPFEEVIKKYGIPNAAYPHCNRELKLNAIFSYKESLGLARNHQMAVGIRSDEIDRIGPDSKKHGTVYPLISQQPTTKAEIRHWWLEQDFDLDLSEHLGNCVTCWEKSDRKLMTVAKNEIERFDFFDRMERDYSEAGAGEGKRVFFRRHRSSKDIIATSNNPFVEFVDYMPELQLTIGFDVDELDIESDCGASCEAV